MFDTGFKLDPFPVQVQGRVITVELGQCNLVERGLVCLLIDGKLDAAKTEGLRYLHR